MNIIRFIIHVLEYIFYLYFAFAALYVLVFAVGSLLYRKTKKQESKTARKIAVLIPGYKEDNVIIEVAEKALKQNYPTNCFDVIIIADSFKSETLVKLGELPVKVIEVSFEKSTKSKALNKAMEQLPEYDIALVLDADNVMEPDFLSKVNCSFDNGFQIVQGHRVAKNTNTSFAVLDAISEELNNSIFRKGHRALGLSSALIGSGMAFEYKLFRKRMLEIHAIGGFDKELELTLLRDKYKIEYLNDALVYDEKVQKVEVFENQRKRWLSAQFIYFGRFFFSGLKHLILKGNIDFFDKVYQMISPPRVLLLGLTTIITALCFVIDFFAPEIKILAISSLQWTQILLVIIIAYLISIPSRFYGLKTLNAVFTLPTAFISMFFSLFKLKGANKKFIHTEHGTN